MTRVTKVSSHSLANLLTTTLQENPQISTEPLISPYKRFAHRISRESRGRTRAELAERETILHDPAIINYLNYLKGSRNNEEHLSPHTVASMVGAIRYFLKYTDIAITDHAIYDLVKYKQNNPNSTDIEQAVIVFTNEQPIKRARAQASYILGIFNRGNFTPLKCRVYNHFEPSEQNCTEGIFREIYKHLTPEQQDMIQWNL